MKFWAKCGIVFLIGFVLVALIIGAKGIFSQTEPVQIFHILCDGFFAVGVVITSAGLLVFSANEGAFDVLVYGISTFLGMFRKNYERKYETLYDYKESRSGKKNKFGFLLVCGVVFIVISLIMYALYALYR